MNLALNAHSQSQDSRRSAALCSGEFRHRALARLYERRVAVENLIDALERYQQGQSSPWQQKLKGFTVLERSS